MRLYSEIRKYTRTFEVEDGFELQIVRTTHNHNFEVWLTHNSIGISDFLFGGDESISDDQIIDIFDANAEEYMDAFLDEYGD